MPRWTARNASLALILGAALLALPTTATAQGEATLEILTPVDGATILVDGVEQGTTPMLDPLVLSEGGHTVRVEKPGFVPYEELIVFFDGDELVLEVDLLPFAGIVRIVTPEAGATVSIDGNPAGVTPFQGEVPVGEHLFLVTRDRYEPWETRAVISAGEEYFFEANLVAMPEIGPEIVVTETTPFYRQWWFWGGAAVVIGGGIAAAILLSEDEQAPPVDFLISLP